MEENENRIIKQKRNPQSENKQGEFLTLNINKLVKNSNRIKQNQTKNSKNNPIRKKQHKNT